MKAKLDQTGNVSKTAKGNIKKCCSTDEKQNVIVSSGVGERVEGGPS